jgi:hypothetical protein
MRRVTQVVGSAVALSAAAAGGALFGPSGGDSVPAPAPVEADASPQDQSALCFTLTGLRRALGPEGRSAIGIFGDENNIFGDVYVFPDELGTAINDLDAAMDPEADGVIANTPAMVSVIAARSTAEAALQSASAEHAAANGLSDEQLINFGSLPEVAISLASLDQARGQADTAIVDNGCDADLFGAEPTVYPYH